MATFDPDLSRLRGRSLFVGTPMYAGQCHSDYAFAIAQLAALCTQLGIRLRFHFACHEALVTRARNVTVDAFLRAADDALIFIDADIGFDPRDVIHAFALQMLDKDGLFDVVAAPYPLKRMAWDQVLAAAKSGLADDDPARLAHYASLVAVKPAQPGPYPANAPVEVTEAGTGFMSIRRETFDRWRAHHATRGYRPERIGLEADASAEIIPFFDTEIVDGAFVSEDYAFCRKVREAGMRIWLCPWMELNHTGDHRFTSRLIDLSALAGA